MTLDENGKAVLKTDLPFGNYYVKEIATDEHYKLGDTKYPVEFSYGGQDTATIKIAVNNGEKIENELIYGSVSGMKKMKTEKHLVVLSSVYSLLLMWSSLRIMQL